MKDSTFKQTAVAIFLVFISAFAWAKTPEEPGPIYQESCTNYTIVTQDERHSGRAEFPTDHAGYLHGMKHRTALDDQEFMIFFTGGKPASFWMQDTPSSLDIAFFGQGNVLAHVAESTTPFSEQSIMPPGNQDINFVLEMRAGRAHEIGLKEGLSHLYVAPPTPCKTP